MRIIVSLLFFSLFYTCLHAQDSLRIKKLYPFIKTEKNRIENDSSSLNYFFQKLDSLEKKLIKKVVILHIGDSHLQADYFPGKNRVILQQNFGNAGRGLVTPFKVGKSNEPDNYKSWSNRTWRAKRVVMEKDTLPIGLSGLTLLQDVPGTRLRIKIANQENLDYAFNSISVIQNTKRPFFPLSFCDSISCFLASIPSAAEPGNLISEVKFESLHHEITMIFDSIQSSEPMVSSMLYGLIFENDSNGLLYHTVGINGAEFRHYAKQPDFIQQTALVKPDLIIFSLGTNEAFNPGFKPEVFMAQMDSLVGGIRKYNPQTSICFTTPGDAMRRVKYKNPRNKIAGRTIINYATENNYAWWNLFEIMGGYGSIQKWYVKGLTSKDKLHLNRRGYELQGSLLAEAILNSYHSYLRK